MQAKLNANHETCQNDQFISDNNGNPIIWLASRSPRRLQLMREYGISNIRVNSPDFDDGKLLKGQVNARQWTIALAYMKARNVANSIESLPDYNPRKINLVLGADTLVIQNDRVIGQPRNLQHAREILEYENNSTHKVTTGVAIINMQTNQRELISDTATVHVGNITTEEINQYLKSGKWQGKAGAYNLSERIEAGWPITFEGDPHTIMGLPVQKILPYLR